MPSPGTYAASSVRVVVLDCGAADQTKVAVAGWVEVDLVQRFE